MLAALTVSGLPTDAFFFAGFLPAKAGPRQARLEALIAVPGTLVFYESPHRVVESLQAMEAILGSDRNACVARELTKAFEETRRGTLDELATHYSRAGEPKGEVVILVGPPTDKPAGAEDIDALLLSLAGEMPASKAAAEAARMTGRAKADLYRRLIELKGAKG